MSSLSPLPKPRSEALWFLCSLVCFDTTLTLYMSLTDKCLTHNSRSVRMSLSELAILAFLVPRLKVTARTFSSYRSANRSFWRNWYLTLSIFGSQLALVWHHRSPGENHGCRLTEKNTIFGVHPLESGVCYKIPVYPLLKRPGCLEYSQNVHLCSLNSPVPLHLKLSSYRLLLNNTCHNNWILGSDLSIFDMNFDKILYSLFSHISSRELIRW